MRQTPRPLFNGDPKGIGQVPSGLRAFLQRAGRDFDRSSRRRKGLRRTYTLTAAGKNRERLLEASKHDIRKYVRRERGKPLPAGADYWDFDCKLGSGVASATTVHIAALTEAIDAIALEGEAQFFIEIVAKPGHRILRAALEVHATPAAGLVGQG